MPPRARRHRDRPRRRRAHRSHGGVPPPRCSLPPLPATGAARRARRPQPSIEVVAAVFSLSRRAPPVDRHPRCAGRSSRRGDPARQVLARRDPRVHDLVAVCSCRFLRASATRTRGRARERRPWWLVCGGSCSSPLGKFGGTTLASARGRPAVAHGDLAGRADEHARPRRVDRAQRRSRPASSGHVSVCAHGARDHAGLAVAADRAADAGAPRSWQPIPPDRCSPSQLRSCCSGCSRLFVIRSCPCADLGGMRLARCAGACPRRHRRCSL